MNRERFEALLDAYGADLKRWPADERAAAEAFASANSGEAEPLLAAARALDGALDAARDNEAPSAALTSAVLAGAPRARTRQLGMAPSAGWALAACALLGVALGFGGAQLAPVASDDDNSYFATAFEAPFTDGGDEG